MDDSVITVRKAKVGDVPAIQALINDYAGRGQMLPRSLHAIYEHLRDYSVIEEHGEVVGCSALHVSWEDLAEIRSLAVLESRSRGGLGSALVSEGLREAADMGIRTVFALTFVPQFFETLGFRVVDRNELPHKIWQECVDCIHFPGCGEVAVVRGVDDAAS